MADKLRGHCVVFHTQTVGKRSHVVECFGKKVDAERVKRERNRTAGMGGFYNVHRATVVRGWKARGDNMDFGRAGRRH